MKNFDFATATRLDLEIWDTQEKIKYIYFLTKGRLIKNLPL